MDWDTQIINGKDKNLIRKILKNYAEWKQPWMDTHDSWMGRRLLSTLDNTNLFTGKIKTHTIVNTFFNKKNYCYKTINSFDNLRNEKLITKKEYVSFFNNLKKTIKDNSFFYSITYFIYIGKKNN